MGDECDDDLDGDGLCDDYCDASFVVSNDFELHEVQSCSVVTGSLLFEYSVSQIEQLQQLRVVQGDLSIYNTYSLESVDGLSGLRSIGGDLRINGNQELIGLDGFSELREVGGSVVIGDGSYVGGGNPALNLQGVFNQLNVVWDGIYIAKNSSMVEVSGLLSSHSKTAS